MTRRQLWLSLAVLIVAAGLAAGGWVLFLRPIQVQILEVQRDVAIQVFGLGTVESRVMSKVGFKVAGVLTDLLADRAIGCQGRVPPALIPVNRKHGSVRQRQMSSRPRPTWTAL